MSFPALIVIAFMLFAPCAAQNRIQPRHGSNSADTTGPAQPRLTKTQGTNQYANIHCTLMDKDGNLWFGTTGEGVYRYDGKSFVQFTKKQGLSSNIVWSILEDRSGRIWMGTDSGLCVYDGKIIRSMLMAPAAGPVLPANRSSIDIRSPKNEVWSMMQDRSGRLWFGTRDGVYVYDGSSFSRFLDDSSILNKDSLRLKMVDCMLEDTKGQIWFCSGMPPGMEGLCRYDGKALTGFRPGGERWIRYIVEDKSGKLWVGTRSHGIWQYDGANFSEFMEGKDIGLSALVDHNGNVWLSGGEGDDGYSGAGGIWRYDGEALKNFNPDHGLGNYSVWCMVQDRDGQIWLGTRNTGLYRFDGRSFTCFSE